MYPYIQCTAVASIIVFFFFHYFSNETSEALNELEHH